MPKRCSCTERCVRVIASRPMMNFRKIKILDRLTSLYANVLWHAMPSITGTVCSNFRILTDSLEFNQCTSLHFERMIAIVNVSVEAIDDEFVCCGIHAVALLLKNTQSPSEHRTLINDAIQDRSRCTNTNYCASKDAVCAATRNEMGTFMVQKRTEKIANLSLTLLVSVWERCTHPSTHFASISMQTERISLSSKWNCSAIDDEHLHNHNNAHRARCSAKFIMCTPILSDVARISQQRTDIEHTFGALVRYADDWALQSDNIRLNGFLVISLNGCIHEFIKYYSRQKISM